MRIFQTRGFFYLNNFFCLIYKLIILKLNYLEIKSLLLLFLIKIIMNDLKFEILTCIIISSL